jgi:NTP pyrophosphatase (non-canonical NTP hydrolase)
MSDLEDEFLMGTGISMSDVNQKFNFEVDQAFVLNNLAQSIHSDNARKGFWENSTHGYESKATKIALIHSELSEMLEGLRGKKMDDKLEHRTMEETELADALIRIFDYAGGYGLDLGGAVMEKLAYNRQRPYKHGKEF